MYSRTRDSRGLNIPEYQSGSAQNVKYETVSIPSTSQVAFNGYSLFDFKIIMIGMRHSNHYYYLTEGLKKSHA